MSNCHPLEVVFRYRDPQLQVDKNLNLFIYLLIQTYLYRVKKHY